MQIKMAEVYRLVILVFDQCYFDGFDLMHSTAFLHVCPKSPKF